MSIDIIGVVAFVEQGFNRDFFVVANFALVVQSDQFRGFTSEHTAINENKFPHELLVVLLILPPTMELQKKSIDALLESMAILRQELQNNQDSEKEIELLGELKLLSARIYIESDLSVMALLPGMNAEEDTQTDDLIDYTEDENVDDFESAELGNSEEILVAGFEEEIGVEELESASATATEEALESENLGLYAQELVAEIEEEILVSETPKEEEVISSKESDSLQQDLFFAAVPVLGGQKNSNAISDEIAKNANTEESIAKIATIDFDSSEFELPEFELPISVREEPIERNNAEEESLQNPDDLGMEDMATLAFKEGAMPELNEVAMPESEGVVVPGISSMGAPEIEAISNLAPLLEVPVVEVPVSEVAEVASVEVPVVAVPVSEVAEVASVEVPVVEVPVSEVAEVASVEVPAVEVSVSEVPALDVPQPPISAINTITESPIDTSSSVELNANGELPPPALSGMNVEAIVNQMPISRRFEFANLLFGGDIQRMGTFIHELLQAPTGSGRMDVYERWYDENNWRRRDEAASDMLRLIKRIFPG